MGREGRPGSDALQKSKVVGGMELKKLKGRKINRRGKAQTGCMCN